MNQHGYNLKTYQLSAAAEGRLGAVCVVMKDQLPSETHFYNADKNIWDYQTLQKPILKGLIKSPFAPGDELVGREAFWDFNEDGEQDLELIEYRAMPWERTDPDIAGGWNSAQRMKPWMSRFRYTITDVNPLWLPDISEEDAVRCGMFYEAEGLGKDNLLHEYFQKTWQAQHKQPWESWVWFLGLEGK